MEQGDVIGDCGLGFGDEGFVDYLARELKNWWISLIVEIVEMVKTAGDSQGLEGLLLSGE
jgi:hypothetical protein